MGRLARKLNMRDEMRFAAAAARGTQALGRTTQAAHSTIAVGDADIPLVETVEESRGTAIELPVVAAEAEVAADDAYEAAMNVDEAHAAADQAVADALKAQQTADGKNAIYRQPINPVAVPEKPFANGDVWYRTIEVSGVTQIADVNMWNGTEWKLYQQVASSVLVPGSVGNVLIQDGAIDALKLTVDALYGKVLRGNEIYGALIDGSKIRLSGLTDGSTIVNDTGTSLTSWTAQGATLALDTTVFETGTRSIRATRQTGSDVALTRAFPQVISAVTAWFRVRVPTDSTLTAAITRYNNTTFSYEVGAQGTATFVPANTWTWVQVSGNATTGLMQWRSAGLSVVGAQPASVWVDRFQLIAGTEDQRSVEITRSSAGSPTVFGSGATGKARFSLTTGAFDDAAAQDKATLSMLADSTDRVGNYDVYGMSWGQREGSGLYGYVRQSESSMDGDLVLSAQGKNVRAISKLDASVGMKAASWFGSWNDNKTAGFWYGAPGYAGDPPGSGWVLMTITKHEDQGLVIQEARRSLTPAMKVSRIWDGTSWSAWRGDSVQGNTFALKSQLDAWNDAPDGTHAWVTATGWEYIRARGKWIVNSTNGEVDITSSLLAAYRGDMTYSIAGGTLFLNINAVGAIGVGQTVVGNLPSELRPLGLKAGAARLSSDYAGSFLVNAAGAVVAATRTGVTHTTATGSVAYATP